MTHTFVRDRLNDQLAALGITRPDACDKCGKPGHSRNIWAHAPERPEDVVWLCIPCYRAANPPAKKSPRDSHKRAKVPPYEQMKADWLSGLTYAEMAEKYGMRNRANVHSRLKQRAMRRGEWPLTREIPAFAVWQTVREALAEQSRPWLVYVSIHAATEYAPFTMLRWYGQGANAYAEKRREVFPSHRPAPAYHRPDCVYTAAGRAGCSRSDISQMFMIYRQDAEDWGYRPCGFCCNGSLKNFAAEHGFKVSTLEHLSQGVRKTIDYRLAAQLLAAVGEPIPEFLQPRTSREHPRPRPVPDEHGRRDQRVDPPHTAG